MHSEMLQLRGAIDLLENAKKVLKPSAWHGSSYYAMSTADKAAVYILIGAAAVLRRELRALLGQNKEDA